MIKLFNQSKNLTIIENLKLADSFSLRLKGLLGLEYLSYGEGLWIKKCNSIHTVGMKFPIDCIFIDQNLRVCSIKKVIKPWRITFPDFKADSVIETAAGTLERVNVEVGDQLYVGN